MPSSIWIQRITVVIGAVLLLGLFSQQSADPDFWWHLKTGEYVAVQHKLPVPDPFSYTTNTGAPAYPGEERVRHFNLTHEWLAQVLMWFVYSAAGFAGVVLARATLLAAMCFVVSRIAFHRTQQFWWAVLAAAGTASIAMWFTADRPALITFFMIPVFLLILETGRGLLWLPVLALIWANCHGGFFLGWVVLGAYWLVDRRIRWIAPIAVLASGLNPNFFGVVRTLVDYRSSYLTSTLTEWKMPYFWGPPYTFDLLLYLGAAVMLWSRRKVRLVDCILFVAFAVAALTAFRNIILIGIVAPVLIATYFPWPLPSIAAASLATAGAAACLLHGGMFRLSAAEWAYPARAAEFLQSHPVSGNLWNTYEYGGYLIWRLWPQQKVFIDGRALNESVYQDYQKILYSPERDALLSKYAAGTIVLNGFEYGSGTLYPIVLALGNPANTDWKLVYEDAQALVFMRQVPAGVQEIPKGQRVIDHLEAECATHIEHDPGLPNCARSLADLSLKAGDTDRARRMLALYGTAQTK